MGITKRCVLVDQLHCLSEDGMVVITAQRWEESGGVPERSWLRLVRNGRAVCDQRFSGARQLAEMEAFWAGLAQRYAATALDEEQMWSKLLELAGVDRAHCANSNCAGMLPAGATWCPECGRSAGRVAAGSMSSARALGDILWDLRKTR